MKKNAQILKILLLVLSVSKIYAQVKIGANPSAISSNVNLEIEANNGIKTVITKDSAKIGIGTTSPTVALDVNGRGRIRQSTLKTSIGTDDVVIIDGNGNLNRMSQDDFLSTLNIPTLNLITKKSTATTYADGVGSVLNFDVETRDAFNEFDATTDVFTASSAGVYEFKYSAYWALTGGAVGATGRVTAFFQRKPSGGSAWSAIGGVPSSTLPTGSSTPFSGNLLYELNTGDQVRVFVQNCAGCTTTSNISDSIFSITRLVKL